MATRNPFTTAHDELIGKRLVHHDRPAQLIGVNRSEAGEFYMIEEYDRDGEPLASTVQSAEMINRIFAGQSFTDWRLLNLETLPRLETGRAVQIVFNGELMSGQITKSFDDGRGYRVKLEGTSFTVPVLNEAILSPSL